MQNIPHRLIPVAFTALIILSVSCSRKKDMDIDTGQDDFAGILVPESRLPLYADLTEHNLNPSAAQTRSDEGTVPLSELIDKDQTATTQHDGTSFKQIPFRDNDEGIYVILHDEKLDIDFNNASPVKKYFIQAESETKSSDFVVTLLPQKEYSETHPDFDYLKKPNYTGYILFSKPDGTLYYARQYHNGKTDKVIVPKKKDVDKAEGKNLSYFSLMKKADTKASGLLAWLVDIGAALYGGTINPSVCNGGGYTGNGNGGGGTGPGGNKQNPNTNNGSGTGNTLDTNDPGIPEWPEDPPQEPLWTLSVSSNVPSHIIIMGSGEYPDGSYAAVTSYYYDVSDTDYTFIGWTGTISQHERTEAESSADMLIRMEDNTEGTALFANKENKIPCWDIKNGTFSPLTTMKVRRTNQYAKYASGLYGKGIRRQIVKDENGNDVYENGVLKTKPRNHDGIDLIAPIGTPVYAIHDGTITKAVGGYSNRKIRRGTGSYGNEIWIKTKIDGTEIIFQYAHLNAGNAIEVNPRTGKPFATGDQVYAGERIGYTGQTGNAYGEPNPHLHFGAKLAANGKWIDPMPYINARKDTDFETSGGTLKSQTCDNGQLIETDEANDIDDSEAVEEE